MALPQAWKFIYWPTVWVLALVPPYILSTGLLHEVGGIVGATMRVLGVLVLVYAFMLHGIAGRTLRYLGHQDPRSRSIWPDRLVTSGIYSCMRHPQHLGLLLIPIGIALVLASPAMLAATGWTVTATLFFILLVEEPECISRFGEKYCSYMARTPAFTLNPSCLLQGLRLVKEVMEMREKS